MRLHHVEETAHQHFATITIANLMPRTFGKNTYSTAESLSLCIKEMNTLRLLFVYFILKCPVYAEIVLVITRKTFSDVKTA